MNVIINGKIKKALRLGKEAIIGDKMDESKIEDVMNAWADSFMIRKKNGLPVRVELSKKELEESL